MLIIIKRQLGVLPSIPNCLFATFLCNCEVDLDRNWWYS
jgi:hypothetical protein